MGIPVEQDEGRRMTFEAMPRGARSLKRPAVGLIAGLAVVAIIAVAIGGVRIIPGFGANASMSLSATVDGPNIAVHGTTDLPDGAVVTVELVQRDEYRRAAEIAQSTPPPGESPWVKIEDVVVRGGGFDVTFGRGDWPPGEAGAGGFFWIDDRQPSAVVERFGDEGGRMNGPAIVDRPGLGRTLVVWTYFDLQ
jgi:hypothetical protein